MKKKTFIIIFLAFFAVSLIILLTDTLNYRQSLTVEEWDLRPVNNVYYETSKDEKGKLILPASLKELPPRTSVTLWAEVEALPGESIFVKSVFAPLSLYVNDELFYEYGQAGTYPSFLNDPPTGLAILKLPSEGGTISLRAEYESLTQRNTLSLPSFYIGEHAALLIRLLQTDGFSFLFSLILIFLGLSMMVIALIIVRRIPSAISFFWLGLFSLAAGIWVFGECDFASRLVPYPSLLYLLDYIGLFLVAIPLLQFGLVILTPKNKIPVRIMLWLHCFSLVAALLLQLTGKVDFIKTLYWFHIITPLAFVFFAVCLVWEGLYHKNPAAKRFAPAIFLLSLSTVLELANYWLNLTNSFTVFFQLGVLFFILSLGIVSCNYILGESLRSVAEKQRLEYEMAGIKKQLSLQRLQYQKMAEDEEKLKKERHDFHHHLAVLYSLTREEEKLSSYIEQLIAKIPTNKNLLICENYVLNAVAAYYYELAEEAKIDIKVSLLVPKTLESDTETDLCVILGNLMENAVEACKRATSRKPFIRINSSLQGDILTITVDNSYSGIIKKSDEAYLSSKHEGKGIGISSVMAAATKHGGNVRFEESEGVFKASVYLRIIQNCLA